MKLKCNRCEYEWDYKGSGYMYTSCPRCRTNVRIGDRNVRERNKNNKATND